MNAGVPNDLTIFNAALDIASESDRLFTWIRPVAAMRRFVKRWSRCWQPMRARAAFSKTWRWNGSERSAKEATRSRATVIGRYKLLEKIGEGGWAWSMWRSRKPVRRRVALKVIKLGMDTKAVIARFEAERQALAMMDHPNIAKVFDAGATDSGPAVLRHGTGARASRSPTTATRSKLPTGERLELFIQVCQAIQHAHQKGIIHRDIKPSNILVTLHDGVPVPKVIDFGIAKATQQPAHRPDVYTQFSSSIGTPPT